MKMPKNPKVKKQNGVGSKARTVNCKGEKFVVILKIL
jgi:hypothetical protein